MTALRNAFQVRAFQVRRPANLHVRQLALRSGELLGGLIVAALVCTLVLIVIRALPFVDPSWLPVAFGTTLTVAFVVLAGWLLLRRDANGKTTSNRALWILGTAGPAFLASSHLGLLLHGTPHYLFGLGGDQANRVAYVTRFASSPALNDAFYADAAPFYPPQWFWVGGQLARLAGIDGWLFYKPYAILTMAIAGAIAFVAWRWLVPIRLAVLFGLVTAVIGGHTNAYEPYSWILICVLPQIVVATHLMCARVLANRRAAQRLDAGSNGRHDKRTDARSVAARTAEPAWPLVVAIGVYLGWAALGYTLIAGFAALVVGLVVVIHTWRARADRGVAAALMTRLGAMAAISAALALLFWHRYLFAVLGGAKTDPSVANDFAPETGARLPLPMLEATAAGVLCLIGLAWIVMTLWPDGVEQVGAHRKVNDGNDDDEVHSPLRALPLPDTLRLLAQSLALLVVTVYVWFLLSGLRALMGSTLLPFRMIPVLTLALALAGVVGALGIARWAVIASPARSHGKVVAVAVLVAALSAIQMAQHVTEEDTEFAAAARNTPPMPADIIGALDQMTEGRDPDELVLLTADPSLYSYRPYFTFQAPAQAYASPAGRYTERLDEIRQWAATDSPAQLEEALDSGPFRAPDALVLNREGVEPEPAAPEPGAPEPGAPEIEGTEPAAPLPASPERWIFPAVINEMPLKHNNSREEIVFRPEQFADPALFEVREVGTRVVIVRR